MSLSIEAMKVVIDSETEKFSAGIKEAQSLVDSFASKAGVALPLVDKGMIALGNTIDLVKSKLGIWLQVAEAALAIANKWREYASQAADAAGISEEFNAITAAADNLTQSVGAGLLATLSGTRDELNTLVAALPGLAQGTDGASKIVEKAAFSIGQRFHEAVVSISTNLEIAGQHLNRFAKSGDINELPQALDKVAAGFGLIGKNVEEMDLKTAEQKLEQVTFQMNKFADKLDEIERSGTRKPGWLARQLGEKQEDALVAEGVTVDALNKLYDQRQVVLARIAELTAKVWDNTEVDKHIAAINKTSQSLTDEAETYGMTKAAAEEYLTIKRALRAIEEKGAEVSPDKKLELEIAAEGVKALRESKKARDDDDAAQKSYTGLLDRTEREIAALRRKQELIGGDKAQAAGIAAEDKLLADAAARKIAITDELRAKARELRQETQATTDAQEAQRKSEADQKAYDGAIRGMERQIGALRERAEALYLTAGAAARLGAEQKTLVDLESRGITITDATRAAISAQGAAIEQATNALREQNKVFEAVRDTGKAVTNQLESAFKSWTQGAQIDVKKMVAAILTDLATLTFRKSVTDNLGDLFTRGAGSLISGFREDGGPVEAGKAYVVGEKRPELFVPDQSGTIVPRLQGATNAISNSANYFAPNIQVDARGATPDAVRMLEARLPQIIMTNMTEARERGMF